MIPKKERQKSDGPDYIEEVTEWQDKQYLPGYYLGGKIPPYLRWPTRNLGYIFVFIGLIGLLPIIVESNQSGMIDNLAGNIPLLLISVILLAAGMRILTKNNT